MNACTTGDNNNNNNNINSVALVVSELYRPSDRLLSAKLVPNFCGNKVCRVVRAAEPYGRNLDEGAKVFIDILWAPGCNGVAVRVGLCRNSLPSYRQISR
jgi:hypothetical protein